MTTPFGKTVRFLPFLIAFSLLSLSASELPKDFWISDEADINQNPQQIWVDSFSLETAKESIDKTGREYHFFKTETPLKLQEALIKSLMKIAASKSLWITTPPKNIWIIKGNITSLGDSVSEEGFWRKFTKNFNTSLGILRIRTEVFVYDTNVSKDHYVIKFETGDNGKENSMNIDDTASSIAKTLESYLQSAKP